MLSGLLSARRLKTRNLNAAQSNASCGVLGWRFGVMPENDSLQALHVLFPLQSGPGFCSRVHRHPQIWQRFTTLR